MAAIAADQHAPNAPAAGVHLVVILHGLFGSPKHIAYLAAALERETASHLGSENGDGAGRRDDQRRKVVVLVAKSNGLSSAHLYDGIDVCAHRIVEDIDTECERLEHEGGKVERFSMVGYSLGGLVARYVLGLLDSRSPSFFVTAAPCSFTTFASPAIGVPVYSGSRFSRIARAVGGNLLSRTGRQLYERDVFLPSARFDPGDKNEKPAGVRSRAKGRIRGEPLLKVMADPRFSFYRALAKFERFQVFANTVNDRTVPFPTGAFEAHDPFAVALRKAKKGADEQGDDPDGPLDLRGGGLELGPDSDAPIIRSYRHVPQRTPVTSKRPRRRLPRIRLPFILRPSTFPLPRPLALLFIAALPVLYPIALVVLISRSLLQIPQSSRRIRRARLTVDGGRNGWLARVGLSADEVIEALEMPAQESAASDGHASTTTSAASSVALLPDGSGGTASSSTSVSSSTNAPTAPTDPDLSTSQLFQIEHLNALPNLTKHYVHLIDTMWAHGAIICRNPKHPAQSCKEVVDWWASRFEV